MQTQTTPAIAVATPVAIAAFANPAPGDLNKINMDIRGDQVLLSGLLDIKGLRLLKKRIESLEMLLAPIDDDDGVIVLADEERPN